MPLTDGWGHRVVKAERPRERLTPPDHAQVLKTRVLKTNRYHDENGLFTTKEKSRGGVSIGEKVQARHIDTKEPVEGTVVAFAKHNPSLMAIQHASGEHSQVWITSTPQGAAHKKVQDEADAKVGEAIRPADSLMKLTGKAKMDAEDAELARLKAMDTSKMSSRAKLWVETAIGDVYWRRRMATRTPEEVARGVVAPAGYSGKKLVVVGHAGTFAPE